MIEKAPTIFDLEALRIFVAGQDLGSYAKAAERLNKSTSAVSAQLKKLDYQAGTALLRKDGRGLLPTDAGETLLAYARRLLALNEEAAEAVRSTDLAGRVRLGLQEDFSEMLLPEVLGQFTRAHPKLRLEASIARNRELIERILGGNLDLALVWGQPDAIRYAEPIASFPMQWITGNRSIAKDDHALPLVAFEAPCLFRQAATEALDQIGKPWQVAFTSSNLSGLWAAARAGLGLVTRPSIGLPGDLTVIREGLPPLPSLPLTLIRPQARQNEATARLAEIITRSVKSSQERAA